jgi:hypothetical protein
MPIKEKIAVLTEVPPMLQISKNSFKRRKFESGCYEKSALAGRRQAGAGLLLWIQ